MLNEAGSNRRVQESICLLGENFVQPVGAGLDWLGPRGDRYFKRTQGAYTVIQIGRRKTVRSVMYEYRPESIDSTRVPTGSV